MIGVFLTPSFAQLFHHHEHFVCNAKNEKHFHIKHDKCAICDFSFSNFQHKKLLSKIQKIEFQIFIFNEIKIEFPDTKSFLNILLRAPPINIIKF